MRSNSDKLIVIGIVLILLILAVIGGIGGYRQEIVPADETSVDGKSTLEDSNIVIADAEDIDTIGVREDLSVYEQDDPESIVYFYVTVSRGDEGSNTDHSFNEVKNAVRFIDDTHVATEVYARALVQIGDENGPQPGMIGYGESETNASIRIRGNSSSTMPQKSYKLDLDNKAGLWRGQRNIALNKSIFDVTRLKNKMYFDLLKDVEDVPSVRTQFARLFVKDETSGDTEFKDYGFYTQAEVPGKKYLANHGLDPEGYLYKAISYNFEMSEELKNVDDPAYDPEAFEKVLSCKGREDHAKLIELTERIEDRSIDINTIIGEYFDRENYITWLAYNILLANVDTTVQNFYLYSPLNSRKWFFIPWDGDNSLHRREDIMEDTFDANGAYMYGVSNYWGVLLHQRFLKNEANRAELKERVDELHEKINRDSVNELVQMYNQIVEPYVLSMPDYYYLEHTEEERNEILSGLGDEVEEAYELFLESLDALMPFYYAETDQTGGEIRIDWDDAYDFQNEDIFYRIRISKTPDMMDPVFDEEGLRISEITLPESDLEPGIWYYRADAYTASGKTSEAMNKLLIHDTYYPGVGMMEVDG